MLKCHPYYKKHVQPRVQFVWELFPFKLFCYDISNILNIIFCPICFPLWLPFQIFAIIYNGWFVICLPCNIFTIVSQGFVFALLGPPALLITSFYKTIEGVILFFLSAIVFVPTYLAILYLWTSVFKSLFNTYCTQLLTYISLQTVCSPVEAELDKQAKLMSILLSMVGLGS